VAETASRLFHIIKNNESNNEENDVTYSLYLLTKSSKSIPARLHQCNNIKDDVILKSWLDQLLLMNNEKNS
jgi:hypothetical protein